MHRRIAGIEFKASQLAEVKEKMLSWSSRFGISLFLDSNGYKDKYGRYECLMGAGAGRMIIDDDASAFAALQQAHDDSHDWLFGHCCYDLKNVLEPHLQSRHNKRHGYRQLQFFIPEVVCFIKRGTCFLQVEALSGDPSSIAEEIMQERLFPQGEAERALFSSGFTKKEYLSTIAALKQHIREGDCYEITLCNEASAENVNIDPRLVFKKLNAISPAPFAAFYQDDVRTMICASPERFVQKEGWVVRSQPMKGTARRSTNMEEDELLKSSLKNSEKEQAENVMITDLVRNDLARSCSLGSITVDELFGIYTFPQVHQMVSTVSGKLRDNVPFTEAIRCAFPMGSMTGAPKHKVMQLIDLYELARRELFSGTVGYISPDGDFDFNVVIRSLFYNADTQYLSYQTGGAITWGSNAELEWEEMRLKAEAMENIFR